MAEIVESKQVTVRAGFRLRDLRDAIEQCIEIVPDTASWRMDRLINGETAVIATWEKQECAIDDCPREAQHVDDNGFAFCLNHTVDDFPETNEEAS